ncbi:hypothetical protein PUNSTDRAFT_44016 [Punctularia strigosozonata HHB-11173 SS5]|uniref:uncharacterized protein n=1 Tax=Punctularia strigosozonata (strain HHB-11173) TaxID=741275 RepID=UPI00044177D8|nr:uncharacterized protein PUNSTDRAFT_44016 [Punctularia strigosozonata HHB-11173 SS5]EIN09721.1 hypothetical protein PUNSTDRAFT_44016 [Punctularia strigosozonata HHB-11173 SS5]
MSLVPTTGAVLIGIFISSARVLWGLMTSQVYIYMQRNWNKDTWRLKSYIVYICSDDVNTGITLLRVAFMDSFVLLCLTPNEPLKLSLFEVSNKNYILVGVVTILAFAHFGLEMAVMALTFVFPKFSQFRRITGYYTGSMAVAAADDIIIALAMTYYLSTRRTGIRRTNTLVNRIITYVITTGALTSVIDIAILICFVVMPDNLVYLSMYQFVDNLYANSLLAMYVVLSIFWAHRFIQVINTNPRLNAREMLSQASYGSTTIAFSNNYPLSGVRVQVQNNKVAESSGEEPRRGLANDAIASQLRFASEDASDATKTFNNSFYGVV